MTDYRKTQLDVLVLACVNRALADTEALWTIATKEVTRLRTWIKPTDTEMQWVNHECDVWVRDAH